MDQELENQPLTEPQTLPEVEVSSDLLEDPVVDYPIENQQEMVTLIEEPAPQTIDVIQGSLQPELEIAVEAINDLLDLHATVKAKGVSSHDMAGLKAIQKRLIDNNIALPTPSLESFDFYTPERSLLNLKPSMENIGKVVIDTIKAWIRKLIDLVMQGYRWVKGLKQKHAVLDAQLVKARDVLIEVRNIYVKMKTLNGVMGAEATKTTSELTETMLTSSTLDRNRVTLYGFSDDGAVKAVKQLFDSARATSESIATRVQNLNELMNNQEIPSDDGICGLQDLASVVQSVDEMLMLSSEPDYLVEKLGADFWEHVEKFRKVSVIDFDELVKHYGSTADALARIRSIKIEDTAQAERAQTVIDSITKAVDHLNKIVGFFNKCAQAQVTAAKTYREYYASAIEILMLDFKSKNPSPQTVKEMKNLIAELQKLK
ncbi:virion structural protein [Pseudomonas phage D6]|nr:virion structural protein [Pseudomonas phage D6]